jgi:xanthine dehydrogenase molybdenum-binding subunit
MPWHLVFYAAALAKAAGRSVKLFYTKEEHFAAYTLRLGSRFTGKIGIKKDGTVMAVSGDWNINTGFCSDASQGMVAVGCGELQLMVRCANWDLKPKLVCTNRNASKMVRGYGGQELESAFLPVLNLALEKANIDPFEFFKKNYIKPGDGYYWRDGKWWVARSANYDTAMDKGAAAFGWKEKWQGWLQPTNVNGAKRTGIGVGVHGNADVGEDVSEAYVRLDPDGTAVVFSCVSETGTGLRSNLCKMAAEVLKLPMEKVSLSPPDTLINPYEFGPVGSRGTYAIGSAVIRAAEDARKKLLEHAALHFNTEPEELDTADGLIFAKGANGKKARWKAALGAERTCMGYGRFEPDFTVPNFLMLFVEVEEKSQVVASVFSAFHENNSRKITVPCITLTDIIQKNDLSTIDLLKVDCEGSEYDIIYHTAPELIRRINKMAIEVHDLNTDQNNISAVNKYIQSLGYKTTYSPINSFCYALEATRQ